MCLCGYDVPFCDRASDYASKLISKMKFHAKDSRHNTQNSHIIPTTGQPYQLLFACSNLALLSTTSELNDPIRVHGPGFEYTDIRILAGNKYERSEPRVERPIPERRY